jgi:hypothetical protein
MFVKLFTQILDSSIADNRRLRHFFTDLLLCADMRGYVVMTEAAISRRIGASMDEVEWGLGELSRPDPRSKTPDHEGRRIEKLEGTGYGWRIINFESYKAMKSAEDMREKTKERVRRHRENKKKQGETDDVTAGNTSNTTQRQRQRQRQSEKEEPPNPQGGDFVFDEEALDPSMGDAAHCNEDGDSGARDPLPASESPVASPNVPSEALRGESQRQGFCFDPEIPLTEKTSSEILPSGWNRLTHAERGRKRVVRNTPIMVRIGKFFGQRESTLWTISDYLALKDVSPNEDDLQLLEDHYSLELENNGYRITSIQTLLNQWPKACSKANIYFSENPNHR